MTNTCFNSTNTYLTIFILPLLVNVVLMLMAKMSWCVTSYGLCLIGFMVKPNKKWCIHLSGSRLSPRTKNPQVSYILNLKYISNILNIFRAKLTYNNQKWSMQSPFSHSIPDEKNRTFWCKNLCFSSTQKL